MELGVVVPRVMAVRLESRPSICAGASSVNRHSPSNASNIFEACSDASSRRTGRSGRSTMRMVVTWTRLSPGSSQGCQGLKFRTRSQRKKIRPNMGAREQESSKKNAPVFPK